MTVTFLYFAYGSNMLTRRLKARTPSATVLGVGSVQGYTLTFDKVSVDRSGKCNIEATKNPNDIVHGVLFKIADVEASELDKAEGLGSGYRKETISVAINGDICEAVTYTATNKNPHLKPYYWYKDIVVAGAIEHNLPNSYIALLNAVDAHADPDVSRAAKNKALLLGT